MKGFTVSFLTFLGWWVIFAAKMLEFSSEQIARTGRAVVLLARQPLPY